MKTFTALLVLLLSACGNPDATVTIKGGADLNINSIDTYAWQVNGIYFIETDDGLNKYCLSIDPSALYPAIRSKLPDFDQARLSTPSAEENAECGHTEPVNF